MGKKPVLHELLAVEGDLEGAFKKILEEGRTTFGKKPDLFMGWHRSLKMYDAEDRTETPDETKAVDETVPSKLGYIAKYVVRYLDAFLQKEATNQEAKADLVLNREVIAEALPATFLLGLESRLKALRSVYEQLPTHPSGNTWVPDETRGKNVYRMEPPEERLKTAKTFKHKTLYDATEHHPAQIEKWEETVNVGVFTRQVWSGMVSPHEKSLYLERIDRLIRAVKKARQRANTTEVSDRKLAERLMQYINHG